MYEDFYGLRERPFDLTADPRYLVPTEMHQEALSTLEYAITSRKGITLLIGEAGTGKTTVIRAAIEKQPAKTHYVHLSNPVLTRDEFIEMLAVRFGLSAQARASKTGLLVDLEQLLRQRLDAGETTVLYVDEAQRLSPELLEEIRLLTNIETSTGPLVSIVLAGQPELSDRLNDQSLRQLKQRIALRTDLRPLQMLESAGYVSGRIAAAGGVPARVFSREAVMLIHERSGGIPRTINVIAENGLVGGFAAMQRPICTPLVAEICRDLGLDGTGSPRPAAFPSPSDTANRLPQQMSYSRVLPLTPAFGSVDSAKIL
jgi:general secretion pathway protein A